MASVTIKNIPEHLLAAVRILAETENRSLNRQLIQLLDEAVSSRGFGERSGAELGQIVREQVAAWRALPGEWPEDIVPPERKGRGRKVDL